MFVRHALVLVGISVAIGLGGTGADATDESGCSASVHLIADPPRSIARSDSRGTGGFLSARASAPNHIEVLK
jgi:hypothetical protein